MTYQEQSDRYRDSVSRQRYEMCIREQAHLTFAVDSDLENKAMADAVIGGDWNAIDAVIAAICVGPNSAMLEDDTALLGAVQEAWPLTASAIYPAGG